MQILLAFAPFALFAVLNGIVAVVGALAIGALTSAVLILRGLRKKMPLKILEVGTFILFAGLALYCWLTNGTLSIVAAKLVIDIGLLAIVVVSMAIGQPFTIQYAKDSVPAEYWDSPIFRRTNYVISGAWAVAFLIIVLAEIAILELPDLPSYVGIIVIGGPILAAVKFSSWYAAR